MDTHDKTHPVVTAAALADGSEHRFTHPLNPNSEIYFRAVGGKSMSELAGLKRLSIYTARIPPGKESFAYHRHFGEEEFMYVLSGRGVVDIDDTEHEVGPGDFVGFPAGADGPAHLVRNPFDTDLVILTGGERHEMEVGEFPRNGQHVVHSHGTVWFMDSANMKLVFRRGG